MKKRIFCSLLVSVMLIMSISVFAQEKTEDVAFDGGGFGECTIDIETYYAWARSASYKPTVAVLSTRITAYETNGEGFSRDGLASVDVSAQSKPFSSAGSYHMFEGRSYSMNIHR